MSENEFNSHSNISYGDLPKDQKDQYVLLREGGFVTKTAKDSYEEFKRQAKAINWKRTLAQKLSGSEKTKPLDLAHEQALQEDSDRKWDRTIARNNEERIKTAWKQYKRALKDVEKGTFPVKKGGLVFRVVNGIRVGSGKLPSVGDYVDNLYATPHTDSVESFLSYNDTQQYYYDHSPFDSYQLVAVIKVDSFEIPIPDITHDTFADKDQVLVKGKVLEVLKPGVFFDKFR